jgi:hypothetical protein
VHGAHHLAPEGAEADVGAVEVLDEHDAGLGLVGDVLVVGDALLALLLGVELMRMRGADGGSLGVADDGRELGERARQRLGGEAREAPGRIDDLQRVADGGCVVAPELLE